MNFLTYEKASILPLIQQSAAKLNMTFTSCLDVGSGKQAKTEWFSKFRYAIPPKMFVAAEIDSEIIDILISRGTDARMPQQLSTDEVFDLTLALEVIEHQTSDESVNFLNFCASHTNKMFALTTPNFEYWNIGSRFDSVRATESYKECRWLPDHLTCFDSTSDNPHHHKQAVTLESLANCFAASRFGDGNWDIHIFRAWPWAITDKARDASFEMFFKIFALAIKRC